MARYHVLIVATAVLGLGALVFVLLPGGPAERAEAGAERTVAAAEAERSRQAADLTELEGGPEAERVEAAAEPADAPIATGETADGGSSIAGMVALPQGFPVDFEVQLWARCSEVAQLVPLGPLESATSFRFEGLLPGTWSVSARATAPDRIAWGRSVELRLGAEEEREGLLVELREYVVEGVVKDTAGAPVADLELAYEWAGSEPDSDGSGSRVVISDDPLMGGIQIDPEAMEMFFGHGNPEPEEVEDHARRVMRLQGLDMLAEAVTSSGQLGEAMTINFVGAEPTGGLLMNPDGWVVTSPSRERVKTNAAGVFRIALPGPGAVTVRAPAESSQDPSLSFVEERERVKVTVDAPRAEVNFELARAAVLRGRVTCSDGSSDDIDVFIRSIGGGFTENVSSGEDGSYRFDGLPEGSYLFYARSGGPRGQDFCSYAELTLVGGEVLVHDDLLTASSAVEGVLVDELGAPLEGVTVVAYGANNRQLSREGRTGPDGVFRIEGMYPCAYRLVVEGRRLEGRKEVDVPPRGALISIGQIAAMPPNDEEGR